VQSRGKLLRHLGADLAFLGAALCQDERGQTVQLANLGIINCFKVSLKGPPISAGYGTGQPAQQRLVGRHGLQGQKRGPGQVQQPPAELWFR
jgi:hypothetical protein